MPGGEAVGPEVDFVVSHLSADGTRALGYRREGGPHRQLEYHHVLDVASGGLVGSYHMDAPRPVPDLARAVSEAAEGAAVVGLDGGTVWTGGPAFSDVELSGDGTEVLLVSQRGAVEVRSVADGAVRARRSIGEGPSQLRVPTSLGAGWVAARVDDATHLWSVSERPVQTVGHSDGGMGIDVSGDGVMLATSGWEGDVVLLDWQSGLELGRWRLCDAGVRDVSFSPDGARLAASDRDGLLRVIDLASGVVGPPLDGQRGIAMQVEWVDGDEVIVGYEDGHMVRWNVSTGQPGETLHQDLRSGWAMDRAGDFLVVAGRDGKDPLGELWNLRTGQQAAVATSVDVGFGAAVQADGRTWAVGSHTGTVVLVVDGEERVLRDDLDEPAMALAFSEDGALLAVGTLGGRVSIHDTATGEELLTTKLPHVGIQDLRGPPCSSPTAGALGAGRGSISSSASASTRASSRRSPGSGCRGWGWALRDVDRRHPSPLGVVGGARGGRGPPSSRTGCSGSEDRLSGPRLPGGFPWPTPPRPSRPARAPSRSSSSSTPCPSPQATSSSWPSPASTTACTSTG